MKKAFKKKRTELLNERYYNKKNEKEKQVFVIKVFKHKNR